MERILHAAYRILFPPVKWETAPAATEPEDERLLSLKHQIEAAQTRFAVAANDEETEAAIYELNALEARYRLLLRRVRAGGE